MKNSERVEEITNSKINALECQLLEQRTKLSSHILSQLSSNIHTIEAIDKAINALGNRGAGCDALKEIRHDMCEQRTELIMDKLELQK